MKKKTTLIVLGAAVLISIMSPLVPLLKGVVVLVALLFMAIANRGVLYALKANKLVFAGEDEKAYGLFKKAFYSYTLPGTMASAYIFFALRQGKLEDAEEAINAILENRIYTDIKKSSRKNILSHKALLLWKQGDSEGAVDILETLIFDNHINSAVYGNLGFLLQLQGDLEKAMKVNKEAMEYSDSDPAIMDNYIYSLILAEEWEEADKVMDQLLDFSPRFPEVYYHKALILKHQGDSEKASEFLDKALEQEFTALTTVQKEDIEKLKESL